MRYSFLINGLIGGGTEKVCKLLANELSIKGHYITLYVFDNETRERFNLHQNVNLIFLGKKNSLASFSVLKHLIPHIKTASILVFNHELALSLFFAKLATRSPIKIISRMNNTFSMTIKFKRFTYRIVVNLLMKIFYRYMDHYIFQSEGIKADLVENYSVKGDSTLLPNPIDIPQGGDKSANKNKILYVGRLVKQKNIKDLLDVVHSIVSINPAILLTIVGDGPERSDLEQYVLKLNLNNNVNFVGQTQQVQQYYLESSLTLLTSFNEGFPNVLLESIANGVPVVSYDCPSGPSEIIQNGINGFLVEYLNKVDLEKRIIEGLNYHWEFNLLIKSIHRFRTKSVVLSYENLLSQYEKGL